MPSANHESAIARACINDGFVSRSFHAFARACCINSRLENPVFSPSDLYDKYRECGTISQHQNLRIRIEKDIAEELKARPVSLHSEMICDGGEAKWDVARYSKLLRDHTPFNPDAWRFRDGQIDVLEVTDTCRVQWKTIVACGLLDDELFYAGGLRVNLIEYRCGDGSIIHHSPIAAFEVCYDFACLGPKKITASQIWDMNEGQRIRTYFEHACFSPDYVRKINISF